VDEIYCAVLVHPSRWFSENILWKIVDIGIIDSLVHVPALIARSFGSVFRTVQTGYVRNYALLLTFGASLLFYLLVLK
jgi:NADH:ubiquinone oxidoreductase subunit 5 (subunit L)/multisubunit Na+/H+ antiporter MnhA subunit